MNYRQALDYVLSFADFERWPGAGYAERWDLRRMEEFLERLGSPHLNRRTIHIAGSKGKGSTAAMIAAVLKTAGYRTGLYTSPHLHTMRERIKVDDELITEDEFAQAVIEVKSHIEATNRGEYGELSTFELLTGLAFAYFKKCGADFQVLETGLGGRLDATNIVAKPDVCVITSISLDHTAVLGDTLAEIAAEKAGIIKPGVTVVCAPQAAEAAGEIRRTCERKRAKLILVGEDIRWEAGDSDLSGQSVNVIGRNGEYELHIPLLGEYQLENSAAAVAALEVAGIEKEPIIEGLSRTQWPGRLEVLGENPLFVADGAHNADSAARLLKALKSHFLYDRSILIVGTSADKNSAGMVAEFAPFFDFVVTTASNHPRANDPEALAAEFAKYSTLVESTHDVPRAVSRALSNSRPNDLVCATGSLFLVAEVIEVVKGFSGERYPDR